VSATIFLTVLVPHNRRNGLIVPALGSGTGQTSNIPVSGACIQRLVGQVCCPKSGLE
jgi:hypothetical protein